MSERKVLNKYYPPDFDPSNIPKLKLPRNRQYSIRIMAPFNMRCSTCGEYIYKGKKFNSRKETVEDEDYLGLRIFRFYIKCPRCVAEIAFKTDPRNTDYELEDGATRNFEAIRTAEILAKKQQQEKEDEEKDNPMKVLENRTKASQREMENLETLEDLKEINSRKSRLDLVEMLKLRTTYEEMLEQLQDEEDEKLVQSIFGKDGTTVVKRLDDDDDTSEPVPKFPKLDKPTDILTSSTPAGSQDMTSQKGKATGSWQKTFGSVSKSSLKAMVKRKTPSQATATVVNGNKEQTETVSGAQSSSETSTNKEASSKPENLEPKESSSTQAPQPSALGLLGNYSDSENSE